MLPELDVDFGAFVETVVALEVTAAQVLEVLRGRADVADQAAEQARETVGTLLKR